MICEVMLVNKGKLLILFLLLLLTGCTAQYNVSIDKDLNVLEKITVLGDERFEITGSYTVDSMYLALTNNYDEIYNIVKNNSINRYSNNNKLAVSGEKSYNNLKDFVLSDYIKILYSDGLSLKEDGNIITVSSDNLMNNFWLFLDDMDSDPLIEKLEIKIKLPFVVTNNNADEVDNKSNTYTWIYDQSSASKQINLEFDKERFFDGNNIFITIVKYVFFFLVIGSILYVGYKFLIKRGSKNNKI